MQVLLLPTVGAVPKPQGDPGCIPSTGFDIVSDGSFENVTPNTSNEPNDGRIGAWHYTTRTDSDVLWFGGLANGGRIDDHSFAMKAHYYHIHNQQGQCLPYNRRITLWQEVELCPDTQYDLIFSIKATTSNSNCGVRVEHNGGQLWQQKGIAPQGQWKIFQMPFSASPDPNTGKDTFKITAFCDKGSECGGCLPFRPPQPGFPPCSINDEFYIDDVYILY